MYQNSHVITTSGFPGGLAVKDPPANAGGAGLIPGSRRSLGEGNGHLLQYSCLGNPMDKRSLVGYSPWGCKVLNKKEKLLMFP